MKQPSIIQGTRAHRQALTLNRAMDNTCRPGSSAFQKKEEKIKWGEEKKTKTTVTKDGGTTTTTDDYETKGTSFTPPKKTPEGDEAYKNMTQAEKNAADDKYIKGHTKKHTKGRSESVKKSDLIKIPAIPIQPIPTQPLPSPELKPVEFKKKRKTTKRRKTNKPGTVVSRTLKKVGKKIKNVVSKCKNNMCGPSNYKPKYKRKSMIANPKFGGRKRR